MARRCLKERIQGKIKGGIQKMISELNWGVGVRLNRTTSRPQFAVQSSPKTNGDNTQTPPLAGDRFQKRSGSVRFGNTPPDGNNPTLNMRQMALARAFGVDPVMGFSLESLRQGFVDANWKLMAEVIVMSKLEPDREQAFTLALDAGEAFLDKLVQAIRPTCSQEESLLLSNDTVMLFVAQSLGWGETMQTEMDRPVYNRNAAQKLSMPNPEPTTNEVITTMQDRSAEELVRVFNLNDPD
jgi:hypothetical protein